MNKNKLFLFVLFFPFIFAVPVFAEETEKKAEDTAPAKLSSSQRANITENCGSIRQSLKLLQRSDTRARTYFGAIYETASSKYITPLNLRLVKNDLSSVSLINLQTSLSAARANFNADYIDYSKSLEELIAIDCNLEPDQFYQKLVSTREKRAALSGDVKNLNTLLTSSVKAVEVIKENLNE